MNWRVLLFIIHLFNHPIITPYRKVDDYYCMFLGLSDRSTLPLLSSPPRGKQEAEARSRSRSRNEKQGQESGTGKVVSLSGCLLLCCVSKLWLSREENNTRGSDLTQPIQSIHPYRVTRRLYVLRVLEHVSDDFTFARFIITRNTCNDRDDGDC